MNKITIRILVSTSAIRAVVDTPAITQFNVFKQVWRPGVILERQPETLAL